MALTDAPSGYDWRAARSIYDALTDDRVDSRDWNDLPEHRRWRYLRAAIAAADEYERLWSARVLAVPPRHRPGEVDD